MTQRKPNLRSVREVTPQLQFRTIHGYRRAFRIAGSGPVILLIHGIGDNSTTWETVQARLAQRFTVIAVDLLGHGQSDKPRADYSTAGYANGMRDLLSVLDIERVTVVAPTEHLKVQWAAAADRVGIPIDPSYAGRAGRAGPCGSTPPPGSSTTARCTCAPSRLACVSSPGTPC